MPAHEAFELPLDRALQLVFVRLLLFEEVKRLGAVSATLRHEILLQPGPRMLVRKQVVGVDLVCLHL